MKRSSVRGSCQARATRVTDICFRGWWRNQRQEALPDEVRVSKTCLYFHPGFRAEFSLSRASISGQQAAAGMGESGAFCCLNSGSFPWVWSPGLHCFCAQSAAGFLMSSVCSQSLVCVH